MVSKRVRTITSATYEAVDTNQEFTLSELEDVLHQLKDTAPGDGTVSYSMIKECTTSYQTRLSQTHQPVIHRRETAHYMEKGQDYTYSMEKLNISFQLATSDVFESSN